MANRILVALLVILGGSTLAIGAAVFIAGVQATAGLAAQLLQPLIGGDPAQLGLGGAGIDNEMRFYAVFFAAWGAVLARLTLSTGGHSPQIPLLLGLFFLGGLGRALSYGVMGPPHPLFVLLMTLELGLPPVLLLLRRQARLG